MGKETEIEELKRQNAIMRAALEKYASRESWSMSHHSKSDIMPVLSSWSAEMYVEDSMAGHIAGGWGVAKAALEEVDGPASDLAYCDVCELVACDCPGPEEWGE